MSAESHLRANDEIHHLSNPRSRLFSTWFPIWWRSRCTHDWELRSKPTYPTEGIVLCFLGNVAGISRLLRHDAMSVDESRPKGEEWMPMMAAAWRGHEHVVKLLISQHSDFASHPRQSMRALGHAIKRGHTDIARTLTVSWAISPPIPRLLRDPYAWGFDEALSAAIRHGHTEVVRLLISQGVKVNVNCWSLPRLKRWKQIPQLRDTRITLPLGLALCLDDVDMARMLLDAGADAGAPPTVTRRHLGVAILSGALDSVRFLLDRGAHPNENVWRLASPGEVS